MDEMTKERTAACIAVNTGTSGKVLVRRSSVEEFIRDQGPRWDLPIDTAVLLLGSKALGISGEKLKALLTASGIATVAELPRGELAAEVAEPDHPSWDEPCFLVEVNGYAHLFAVLRAASLLADDEPQAEALVREVLESPDVPASVGADARGILGVLHKWREDYAAAEPLLASALKLGRQEGWALAQFSMDAVYADALAHCLTQSAAALAEESRFDEATVRLQAIRDLINKYKDDDKFQTVHHEGFVLQQEALVSSRSRREKGLAEALEKLFTLVSEPYLTSFLEEHLSFVIGLAYQNIGRIYLAQRNIPEAVKNLRASLTFYDRDSEDAEAVSQLLSRVERTGR